MYLRRMYIANSGPVESLDLEFPFDANGLPIPLVLIGGNGSGKTNVLSIVADALFEGAAGAFEDILAGATSLRRNWFRVVGAKTITYGSKGGFSILQFDDGPHSRFFKEKGGRVSQPEARERLPSSLQALADWTEEGSVKEFSLSEEDARRIYTSGCYVYFPSSRAEYPHWLNREALREDRFDTSIVFTSRLGKPVFVEQGVEKFAQWLMSVIVDARVDVATLANLSRETGVPVGSLGGMASFAESIRSASGGLVTYELANRILKIIMHDPNARFTWGGRRYPQKIAIISDGKVIAPGLDGLSGGQASLLTIFGTLLRYGDSHQSATNLDISHIEGICIIDEIDAHMHVDLQLEALPHLIAMFPRVQFLISGHSPLFAMGLEKHLSPCGVRFVEMPAGRQVSAEAYREFENALNAFKNTQAFGQAVADAASHSGKPKVWLEGETDPEYFAAAVGILGFDDLVGGVDFEWIGAKSPQSNQGFNTGKDALDKAWSLLSAKPSLVQNTVILYYDCDTGKTDADCGDLHKRVLQLNKQNKIARKGVENLLPEGVFTDDMYDTVSRDRDYGGNVTTRSLNKVRLCEKLCVEKNPNVFENFRGPLDEIRRLVTRP